MTTQKKVRIRKKIVATQVSEDRQTKPSSKPKKQIMKFRATMQLVGCYNLFYYFSKKIPSPSSFRLSVVTQKIIGNPQLFTLTPIKLSTNRGSALANKYMSCCCLLPNCQAYFNSQDMKPSKKSFSKRGKPHRKQMLRTRVTISPGLPTFRLIGKFGFIIFFMTKFRKNSFDSADSSKVLQLTLVYLTNIPPALASEQFLTSASGLARYGSIVHFYLKPKPFISERGTFFAAYVGFREQVQAAICIVSLDGFAVGQSALVARYGVNKRCKFQQIIGKCSNKRCAFIHGPCIQTKLFKLSDKQFAFQYLASVSLTVRISDCLDSVFPHPQTVMARAKEHAVRFSRANREQQSFRKRILELATSGESLDIFVQLNMRRKSRSVFSWAQSAFH